MSSIALGVLVGGAPAARAEADTFGLGDGHNGAKVVSGAEVINSYASLVADASAGDTALSISKVIGDAAGFAAGDLVLVWRATGVAASEAPSGAPKRQELSTALSTSSSGDQSGLVGLYELARVQAASGGTITLTKPLVNGFGKFVSQVVRVPEYTTVEVPAGASIVATAFQEIDGDPAAPKADAPWAGGIAIFLATGAITNHGVIHANARGFHGGLPRARAIGTLGIVCDNRRMDGNPTNSSFSPKGQGVVHSRYLATVGGKGNVSNAGGGGNCIEGGGGGGANRGNGGSGSGSILGLGAGGLGGSGVDFDALSRLTMGGGGGAGRHIVGLLSQVSFGGFGGGVVYIRGGSLGGAGRIEANGGHGEDSGLLGLPTGVASEGSGGGGAGGTVVVRLTGALDCKSIGSPGGDGGDAKVLGLNIFGSGGGGGGGRVLFQASSKTDDCEINVAPGMPGNEGQGGSQAGAPGSTQPPDGSYCYDTTPGNPGACADPRPICDLATGECKGCSGPYGGGTAEACSDEVKPVCMATGDCVPCDGDLGTGAARACQLATAPYCSPGGLTGPQGSCGKCQTNAHCAGPTHGGPLCNVLSGSCGTACATDADCKPTEWCAGADADGNTVCTPKTPNNQPVTELPPIHGECTPESGSRTCLSTFCEEDDDICGKKNDRPCGAAGECRSDVCFDGDDRCGKPNDEPCGRDLECRADVCFALDQKCGLPNGQPCSSDGECRSDQCEEGKCVGCTEDSDCKQGEVCDPALLECVPGCRPSADTLADGGLAPGACPEDETCVVEEGATVGECQPKEAPDGGGSTADGGATADDDDTWGLIEGGGCACNTTLPSPASPLALLGAATSALLLLRRRSKRSPR